VGARVAPTVSLELFAETEVESLLVREWHFTQSQAIGGAPWNSVPMAL